MIEEAEMDPYHLMGEEMPVTWGGDTRETWEKLRAENERLRELRKAVEKLMPYIRDIKMEGETDYEKRVLELLAALAATEPRIERRGNNCQITK